MVCVLVCLGLVLGIAHKCETTVYASELTNESIKKKEAEINKAKEEKKSSAERAYGCKSIKKEAGGLKSGFGQLRGGA